MAIETRPRTAAARQDPACPCLQRSTLGSKLVVIPLFVLQAVAALYFVSGILGSLFGVVPPPVDWQLHEAFEIGAALALVVGLVFGAHVLLTMRREAHLAHEGLRRASSDFADLLDERFEEWHLTPAERDVALFAIKGLSLAEIARLRDTSEGTVKAQTAAIYRKAGVSARSQLVSLFIEDLMAVPDERAAVGRVESHPGPSRSEAGSKGAAARAEAVRPALVKSAAKKSARTKTAGRKRAAPAKKVAAAPAAPTAPASDAQRALPQDDLSAGSVVAGAVTEVQAAPHAAD